MGPEQLLHSFFSSVGVVQFKMKKSVEIQPFQMFMMTVRVFLNMKCKGWKSICIKANEQIYMNTN